MGEVGIIGLDPAKNVVQAHGTGADGSAVFRRKLSRAQLLKFMGEQPPCIVAMDACASAHPWGRVIGDPGNEPADPAGLREASEERHGGCGGDRRGRIASDPAVCPGEERGPAGGGDGMSLLQQYLGTADTIRPLQSYV